MNAYLRIYLFAPLLMLSLGLGVSIGYVIVRAL